MPSRTTSGPEGLGRVLTAGGRRSRSWRERAVDDLLGDLSHPRPGAHGGSLDEAEGVRLGHLGVLDQLALGFLDHSAGGNLVLGRRPLWAERLDLGVDGPILAA